MLISIFLYMALEIDAEKLTYSLQSLKVRFYSSRHCNLWQAVVNGAEIWREFFYPLIVCDLRFIPRIKKIKQTLKIFSGDGLYFIL